MDGPGRAESKLIHPASTQELYVRMPNIGGSREELGTLFVSRRFARRQKSELLREWCAFNQRTGGNSEWCARHLKSERESERFARRRTSGLL